MKHFTMCLLFAATACGGGAASKAPPPFRPKVVETPPPPPTPTGPTDCQPTTTKDQLPAVTYQQRSRDEAQDLASNGLRDLKAAESTTDKGERERLITSAVQRFINALLADPYNVDATYNLAAAYARIQRPQCSLNLLERLLQMRSHPSKTEEVEQKLDRLLGRKKQMIDPDFASMRGDQRFRTLIRQMCAGSSDGDCAN